MAAPAVGALPPSFSHQKFGSACPAWHRRVSSISLVSGFLTPLPTLAESCEVGHSGIGQGFDRWSLLRLHVHAPVSTQMAILQYVSRM